MGSNKPKYCKIGRLRQKGHDRSIKKQSVVRQGKNIVFGKRGGGG
jgi:hypothetical protein